jgi:hypothetical protein
MSRTTAAGRSPATQGTTEYPDLDVLSPDLSLRRHIRLGLDGSDAAGPALPLTQIRPGARRGPVSPCPEHHSKTARSQETDNARRKRGVRPLPAGLTLAGSRERGYLMRTALSLTATIRVPQVRHSGRRSMKMCIAPVRDVAESAGNAGPPRLSGLTYLPVFPGEFRTAAVK